MLRLTWRQSPSTVCRRLCFHLALTFLKVSPVRKSSYSSPQPSHGPTSVHRRGLPPVRLAANLVVEGHEPTERAQGAHLRLSRRLPP